jgi:hypothetical protein
MTVEPTRFDISRWWAADHFVLGHDEVESGLALLEVGIVGRCACRATLIQCWYPPDRPTARSRATMEGYARLSTTAIYTKVSGWEEAAFAVQFWEEEDFATGSSLRPANGFE